MRPAHDVRPGSAVEFYDFATRSIRRLATLDEAPLSIGMTASPDGRWILFVRDRSESDVMLVENFR